MGRQINDAGLELIKSFEGFKSDPYPDPGTNGEPYTIGYGTTLYLDGTKVTLQDPPIDEPTANQLLQNLLNNEYCPQVESVITVTITDNQFAAAVSFCFNVGIGNLKQSTFLKCMNNYNFSDAAGALLLWNKSNGIVMSGLTKRRQAEKTLFLS